MNDESTKQAAQEYLASMLTKEEEDYEREQNRATAIARAPLAWKKTKETIYTQCNDWNAVTKEETFTCKETAMGDLRLSGQSETNDRTV